MHKGIVIGLGAALATFAVGVAQADASCNGHRACRCPPAYGHAPPPRAYAPAYNYAPPAYQGYGPSAARHSYPPAAYGRGEPYAYGASYYGPPPPVPRAPLVGYSGYGHAPPRYRDYDYAPRYRGYDYTPPYRGYGHAPPFYNHSYRPAAGLWLEIR
jgi:hypothetical protein